jgi:hypothetical protein
MEIPCKWALICPSEPSALGTPATELYTDPGIFHWEVFSFS